jgi:hypothetical protein
VKVWLSDKESVDVFVELGERERERGTVKGVHWYSANQRSRVE